jgi:hypothetical protein
MEPGSRRVVVISQEALNAKVLQRIHLISTGGTIEKIYSETTGSVVNLETKSIAT